MKYKALITDVDGTLTMQSTAKNRYALPSQGVSSAIARAKDIIHIGIATSRPLPHVLHLFDHLTLTGPSILSGGSHIVDGSTRQTLWQKTLSRTSAESVLHIVEKFHIEFTLMEISGSRIVNTNRYMPQYPLNIFLGELPEERLEEIHEQLKTIPDIAIHKTPSWSPNLWAFDVTHAQATKQHGILQVAEILGIQTDEIIGVGDGYNDFPLLMACGLKVAMGNAVDDLKAIADYIAPSIANDGLADVIEKFVLEDLGSD